MGSFPESYTPSTAVTFYIKKRVFLKNKVMYRSILLVTIPPRVIPRTTCCHCDRGEWNCFMCSCLGGRGMGK